MLVLRESLTEGDGRVDEDAAREFRGMPDGVALRGDDHGRRRAGSGDVVPPG